VLRTSRDWDSLEAHPQAEPELANGLVRRRSAEGQVGGDGPELLLCVRKPDADGISGRRVGIDAWNRKASVAGAAGGGGGSRRCGDGRAADSAVLGWDLPLVGAKDRTDRRGGVGEAHRGGPLRVEDVESLDRASEDHVLAEAVVDAQLAVERGDRGQSSAGAAGDDERLVVSVERVGTEGADWGSGVGVERE